MSQQHSQNDFAEAGQPSAAFLQAVRGLQVITLALAMGITRSDLQSMNTEDQQMTVLTSMRAGHIIGSAILEGAVVINAIAYLIEKWIGSLAIAGVFIVLIILRLPSVYGTLNKVNDRIREIEMS